MTLSKHLDHKWSQHGRCVFCDDCGVRLYQGKLPRSEERESMVTSTDAQLEAFRSAIEAKVAKEWAERTSEQQQAWEEGKASYVEDESIMDRMRRGNPYKATALAKWYNMGWTNAEFTYYERGNSDD